MERKLSKNMSSIRTFIAIPCPISVQGQLELLGKEIVCVNPQARLISPFNYHITLAYLGDTDEATVRDIKDFLSFEWEAKSVWEINKLGLFSTQKIVYAAGPHSPVIEALGEKVRKYLRKKEAFFDDKPLRPHISLARKAYICPECLFEPISMQIEKPVLFQSGVKINNKLTYIQL